MRLTLRTEGQNRLQSTTMTKSNANSAEYLAGVFKDIAAVGFIGHSWLSGQLPYGSIGLSFDPSGRSCNASMKPNEGPLIKQTGTIVKVEDSCGNVVPARLWPRIETQARVIFVAACALTDVFRSLWDIDMGTDDKALLVTEDNHTNLAFAKDVWREIAGQLARRKTVEEARLYGNQWAKDHSRFYLKDTDTVPQWILIGSERAKLITVR
jgi:hypothetical protein